MMLHIQIRWRWRWLSENEILHLARILFFFFASNFPETCYFQKQSGCRNLRYHHHHHYYLRRRRNPLFLEFQHSFVFLIANTLKYVKFYTLSVCNQRRKRGKNTIANISILGNEIRSPAQLEHPKKIGSLSKISKLRFEK